MPCAFADCDQPAATSTLTTVGLAHTWDLRPALLERIDLDFAQEGPAYVVGLSVCEDHGLGVEMDRAPQLAFPGVVEAWAQSWKDAYTYIVGRMPIGATQYATSRACNIKHESVGFVFKGLREVGAIRRSDRKGLLPTGRSAYYWVAVTDQAVRAFQPGMAEIIQEAEEQ